ncbi:MAG: DcaP family trimeric outer membrane transporter [Arenicella sp.]
MNHESKLKFLTKVSPKIPLIVSSIIFSSVTQAGSAGPVKIGGTEIKISGYIKADVIASDVDSSAGGRFSFANQLVAPGFIPLEGSPGSNEDDLTLHARQSRLIVSAKSGDFNVKLEGDFFGAAGNERTSNSNNFRVRVAWAQYGNWGFGQNWSAATIFPSFADQLNFSGFAGGYSAIRQTGIRYTNQGLVLALENPETTVSSVEPGPTSVLQGTDSYPDLIARYGTKGSYGAIQGALLIRGLSDTTGDLTDTGIGAIIGGTLKLGAKDDLKFLLGKGSVGRILGDSVYADAEIVDGNLEALDVTSAQIAYRHFWSSGVRSTVLYSAAEADNDDSYAGSILNKKTSTVMANLLWDLSPKTTMGIEFSKTEREIESGAKGELNRIQFSMQQKF